MNFKTYYFFFLFAGFSLGSDNQCRMTSGNILESIPLNVDEIAHLFEFEGTHIDGFDANRFKKIRINYDHNKHRKAILELIKCPVDNKMDFFEEHLFGKGLFAYHAATCISEILNKCYLLFLVLEKNDVCVPTPEPHSDYHHKPGFENLNYKEAFNSAEKKLGKGAYGETALFEWREGEKEIPVAIKRISVLNFHPNEVFYAKKFSVSPYGSKFYGCQFEKEWVYLATDYYKSDLSKLPLTSALKKKKSQRWRVSFYRKLFRMLIDLRNFKIVHCDIKAANIMLDEHLNPHLIDYDAATRLGGLDSGRSSQLYRSPKRVPGAIAESSFDLYSMAWVIYVIEHQKGEEGIIVVRKNPESKKREFVPDVCWESPRPHGCTDLFKKMAYDTFSADWGVTQFDSLSAEFSLADLLTKLISEEWTGTLEEIDQILAQIEEKASDKTSAMILI